MLLTEYIRTKVNNHTKEYYKMKGYTFNKANESILVYVYDLPPRSKNLVLVRCDECYKNGKITVFEIEWSKYNQKLGDLCDKCKSLIGKKFGKLVVLKELSEKIGTSNSTVYLCKCTCENETIIKVRRDALINGNTTSCGCQHIEHMKKFGKSRKLDLAEKKFNYLTVLEEAGYANDGKIIWKCRCDCGNITFLVGSKIKRGLVKSCGCINKKKGKEHFNWKQDLPEEIRIRKRYGKKYKEWRERVYIRDNYTCQCCNKRGGNLNAHHIFSYTKYPKLRYEDKNGITLCEECHYEFHEKYGFKRFTPEDFQEFYFLKTGKEFDLNKLKVGELINAV